MMKSKFLHSIIKWTVEFSAIFRHVHRAGKLRPPSDYYELDFLDAKSNSKLVELREKYGDGEEVYFNCDESERGGGCTLHQMKAIRECTVQDETKRHHNPSCPYRRLVKTYPFASQFHKYKLAFDIYLFIKYGILCALDTKLFDEYRYIDCILVGRFILNGRTGNFARYVVLFVATLNSIWSIQMFFSLDRYNLDAFEFMITDLDEIVEEKSRLFCESEAVYKNTQTSNVQSDQKREIKQKQQHKRKPTRKRVKNKFQLVKILMKLTKNLNDIKKWSNASNWKKRVRPIRTLEAWYYISDKLIKYIIVSIGGTIFLGLSLFIIHIPIHLTKLGFILTQDHCSDWIVFSYKHSKLYGYDSLNEFQKFALNYIHKPKLINFTITKDMKSIWLKFEDLTSFNLYHLIRICSSFIETWIFGLGMASLLFSGLILQIICIEQVFFYILFLKQKLKSIKLVLQQLNLYKSIAHSHSHSPSSSSLDLIKEYENLDNIIVTNENLNNLEFNIQKLQWMLIDLFKTIKSNNVLIADFTTRCMYMWLGYSALAVGWMFQPGPFLYTSKLECYLIHAFATFYMYILFAAASKVRRESNCLYKLSASCMALTSDNFASKTRWQDIMRFYHPHPMNCFTIFQDAQMSWSLAMKVIAWLFSALFVASSYSSPLLE